MDVEQGIEDTPLALDSKMNRGSGSLSPDAGKRDTSSPAGLLALVTSSA
jgi:hypothetical protein